MDVYVYGRYNELCSRVYQTNKDYHGGAPCTSTTHVNSWNGLYSSTKQHLKSYHYHHLPVAAWVNNPLYESTNQWGKDIDGFAATTKK